MPTSKDSSFSDDPRRAELLRLYAEVDQRLGGFRCDDSTECCRFGITGREPYPTAVELAELSLALRRRGGRFRASLEGPAAGSSRGGRRHLPMAGDRRTDEAWCPLLDDGGRCRVYEARPFGCRTFFCHRAEGPGPFPRGEIQRLGRDLADLSARFAPRDGGPRPLRTALVSLAKQMR